MKYMRMVIIFLCLVFTGIFGLLVHVLVLPGPHDAYPTQNTAVTLVLLLGIAFLLWQAIRNLRLIRLDIRRRREPEMIELTGMRRRPPGMPRGTTRTR